LYLPFNPPPADSRSPEINNLISGETIGSNRAIRVSGPARPVPKISLTLSVAFFPPPADGSPQEIA